MGDFMPKAWWSYKAAKRTVRVCAFAFAFAFAALVVWSIGVCAGIRALAFVLQASPFGVLAFALASALRIRASSVAGWCFGLCAGIRVMVFAVHASPLCGAAPTFLCRRKEK